MHKKQFSRVCIIHTVYTLLLYLLYSSEEQINSTYFFFCNGIDKSIRSKFVNTHHFFPWPKISTNFVKLLYYLFLLMSVWLVRKIRWPFLKTANLFIQDHLPWSYAILGNSKYTLLEDGPYCFSLSVIPRKKPDDYMIKWIIHRFISKAYHDPWGDNVLCNEIIITQNEILPYMKDKKIIVTSLSSLWEKSPESKRNLILNIFDLEKEDIEILKSRENILFTQCFIDDGELTEEEHSRIYRKIVNNYDHNTLLIKKHPRETFDYKSLFPDIPVFEKPIPMQLFDLLGVRFKRAITVFSSIVVSFDYDIAIDWYGTEISNTLLRNRGSKKCPPPLYTKNENNNEVVK